MTGENSQQMLPDITLSNVQIENGPDSRHQNLSLGFVIFSFFIVFPPPLYTQFQQFQATS
jgi:hypothetical protein